MFVSSYSTYIQSDISSKESKQRLEKPNASSDSFSEKLSQKSLLPNLTSSAIPIDYISKGQTHTNKQELEFQQKQLKNPEKNIASELKNTLNNFSSHNSLSSAKSAYEHTSNMYSTFQKQSISIDQTPQIDRNLPQEALEAKELTMRHQMVNTYISNDNYYKVTA